ncbi:MAG TPA: hypothetical protein VIJ78_12525 [Pseudolabrys sp.]|nr:hypothetical protein [Pseudolabrys sp.]
MALDLDPFAVLRAIGGHSALFASVRTEANKLARALIVKKLKAKDSDLKTVRDLRRALGDENFGLVVDGMKDSEVKSLSAKLDKHHPELKTANAAWRRRHLLALASGSEEPRAKPVKTKKIAGTKGTGPGGRKPLKEPQFLADESAGAVRRR